MYTGAAVTVPAVTVQRPTYMEPSFPVVVVNCVSHVTADNVAPARVTAWLVWVIVSEVIATVITMTSSGFTERVVPVAETGVVVSVVSAPWEAWTLHTFPLAMDQREIVPNAGEPEETVIVSVPVMFASATRIAEVEIAEPASALFATEPEATLAIGHTVAHVGNEPNGLLIPCAIIRSFAAIDAGQFNAADVVPATAVEMDWKVIATSQSSSVIRYAAVAKDASRSPTGIVNSSPTVTAFAVIVPEHRKVPAVDASNNAQWV